MYKTPRLIWIILGLLLLISLVSLAIAIKNPSGRSYPYEVQASPAQVNYQKISSIVAQQIAALPKAPAGANGLNGTNGKDGSNGVPGQSIIGVQGPQGPVGPQGEQGAQGDPGIPGLTVQLRYNTLKSEIQWKYTTDLTWHPLVTACTLTNTCP